MINQRFPISAWWRFSLLPLFVILLFGQSCAENRKQDSLRAIFNAHSSDTTGFEALILLARSYFGSNLDSVLVLGERGKIVAGLAQDTHYLAESENCLGIARLYQSNNEAALQHFKQVLELREIIGDKKLIAGAANNVAIAYQELGDFSVALDYHIYSLKIKEELGDSTRIRVSYNNIGLIYENLQDYPVARSYYRRAMDFLPNDQDSLDYLTTLYNIGVTYFKEENNDSARIVFNQSLPIARKIDDKRMLGLHFMNLGALDQREGKLEPARRQIQEALTLFNALGKQDMIVSARSYLGLNYLKTGQPRQALSFCKQAWELARDTDNLDKQVNCLDCMHQSYAALGNPAKAYETAMQYNALRDSLGRKDVHKQIVRQVMAYDFKKQQQADSLETARNNALVSLKYENKIRRQQFLTIFVVLVGVFLLILAVLFFINFRNKKRQSQILEMRVQARTQALEKQKDQLAEYAFINAHLMRHPLTQIMGLIPLIQSASSKAEQDQYLILLDKASQKLDGVIHDVRDLVEKQT